MRKMLAIVALGAAVSAFAGPGPTRSLSDSVRALNEATSLRVRYTAQAIGDVSATYSLELKKPNLARIEMPGRLIVADGTAITTYDRKEGVYASRPQTDKELALLFQPDALQVWEAFFNPKADMVAASKDGKPIVVGGQKLDVVEATFDRAGRRTVTFYLHPSDRVPRKAQIEVQGISGRQTTVVSAQELVLGGEIDAARLAFRPSATDKQIAWEEMDAPKWLTDLEQAKRVARETGRPIFVDFYATWCVPCKKLDAEVFQKAAFRKYAQRMVLCRIDVDAQKAVAQLYRIEAMPTQMLVDKDGLVLDSTVGYGSPEGFYKFIEAALRSRG